MLAVLVAAAQEPPPVVWTPIVEVRGRWMVEGHGFTSRYIAQRARLGVDVQRAALGARVSFQEVRGWRVTGDDVEVTGSFAPDLAEGWGRVTWELSPAIHGSLTIGRQAIEVDEGRLVGRRDWEMEGQFLDAVRVVVHARPIEVEYVNARRWVLSEGDPLGFGVNVLRFGASGDAPLSRWKADLVSVVDARATAETTTTAGLYTRLDQGRLRSRGEVYVQQNPRGTGSLVAGEAGWVFGPDEAVTLAVGGDLVSGDRGTIVAFQPVLGDTHDVWGLLDLFSEPREGGLADLEVRVDWRPTRRIRAAVSGHRFGSSVDGSVYGWEADGRVAVAISPFGSVEGGYGHFFPGPGFDAFDRLFLVMDVDF